jgi:hypothetical protein
MVAVVMGYYTLLLPIYLSVVGLLQVKTMPIFENQSKYAAVPLLCDCLIDKAVTVHCYMCVNKRKLCNGTIISRNVLMNRTNLLKYNSFQEKPGWRMGTVSS